MSCPVCGVGTPVSFCQALLYDQKSWPVDHCPACDASYFWPVPAPADIARCYPHSYFKDFFKQYWKDFYKGRALAQSLKHWKAQGTFLDVGCALGTLLAGFREESQWQVYGMEYMPAAAAAGKKLNQAEIAVGGIVNAPWADATFDYIHANNVLEHESSPFDAIASAARLLKPGGRLHLVLPNGKFDLLPNVTLYRRLGKPVRTYHSGHLFFYSEKSLRLLLARHNFEVLSLKSFHFKTAFKARGLMPRAYKKFFAPDLPPSSNDGGNELSSDYSALIPARPSWPVYSLRSKWRQLWRLPNTTWGYDFEIIAAKK